MRAACITLAVLALAGCGEADRHKELAEACKGDGATLVVSISSGVFISGLTTTCSFKRSEASVPDTRPNAEPQR